MARALHFDCFSGVAGDMTLAALLDAGADEHIVRAGLDSMQLPIRLNVERVRKGGFAACYVYIQAPEESAHRHLPEVEAIILRANISTSARNLALRIFRRLAEAEASVHGIPIEKVHFHEVGALDSIADIVGVAIAMDSLGIESVSSRSVPTGSGMVKCAHGLMPVPTPATLLLLRGAPLATSTIKTELTTPTGAAILAATVSSWSDTPAMVVHKVGLGAGTKDFLDQPNVLRLWVGETLWSPANRGVSDCVWLVQTNLDDVPGEVVGYCFDALFAAGALDVFTTAIQMKKNRPGVMLSVLVSEEKLGEIEAILFRETQTFGLRRTRMERSKLDREIITVPTPWGDLRAKRGLRDGLEVLTPEYEDCARVAREHNIPLRQVMAAVRGQPANE
jgi:hypothetical protein